mmetsp:Transcript_142677/g.355619  ORF Transcript_142677/g.355619 Transcript_142677/m.355619 type:complete len:262 (-) Transcript_142677:31-816(-)
MCTPCCATESLNTTVLPHSTEDGAVSKDVPSQEAGSFSDSAGAEVFGCRTAPPAPSKEQSGELAPPQTVAPELTQGATDTATSFEVPITLAGTAEVGIGLDLAEGKSLRICRIYQKGCIPEYNASVSPNRQVQVGDFIVGINTKDADCTAEELVEKLKDGGDMRIAIRRPFEFTVAKLDKNGGGLGLDLSFHPRGTCAKIRSIFSDGAVPRYNETVSDDMKIQVNDCIVSVNGKTGSAKEMVEALGSAGIVDFVLARPAAS